MAESRSASRGPAARAVDRAVRTAVAEARVNEDLDGLLLAALRIVAAGLDRIDPAASPIGAQRLSRELRALTETLRLTPDARNAGQTRSPNSSPRSARPSWRRPGTLRARGGHNDLDRDRDHAADLRKRGWAILGSNQ